MLRDTYPKVVKRKNPPLKAVKTFNDGCNQKEMRPVKRIYLIMRFPACIYFAV